MRKPNLEFFEAYLIRPLVLLGVFILLIHTPFLSAKDDFLIALGIIFEGIGLFLWNRRKPVSYNIKYHTLLWIRRVVVLIIITGLAIILLELLFSNLFPSKFNSLDSDLDLNLDDLNFDLNLNF